MIMNLRSFEGKTVRLIDNEDKEYEGYVEDYVFAEDNAPEEVDALILDNLVRKSDGYKFEKLIEFTAPEIKSIDAIDRQ